MEHHVDIGLLGERTTGHHSAAAGHSNIAAGLPGYWPCTLLQKGLIFV